MDINPIHYWHWWALGIFLIVLGILEAEIIFLLMGVSAGIVGAILFLEPTLGWQYQFMVFSVFSIVSIATWRLYLGRRLKLADRPSQRQRAEQYVGRQYTLQLPIIGGEGTLQVDGSTWNIRGEDCDAGNWVRVISVAGTILVVEKL